MARGAVGLDRTKVTITVKNLGVTGLWAEAWLRENYNLQVEMSDLVNLLVIVTAGNIPEDLGRLITGLRAICALAEEHPRPLSRLVFENNCLPPEVPMLCTPREAFFRPSTPVPLEKAIGRVAAETVTCYPPGIPVLCPGERIIPEIADYLFLGRRLGMHFQGPQDPTLRFIKVLLA